MQQLYDVSDLGSVQALALRETNTTRLQKRCKTARTCYRRRIYAKTVVYEKIFFFFCFTVYSSSDYIVFFI